MKIGIDASRAFRKERTGIEEYSYQVIKYLRNQLGDDQACLPIRQVILYIKKAQSEKLKTQNFKLPANWKIKTIWWPRLWTQVGLSLELLLNKIDVLFIPAHVVPIIHPARHSWLFKYALVIQKILKGLNIATDYNKYGDTGGSKKTIVTVHGLEYEFYPQAYSFWERLYMRWSIKNSCRWASKIIAVSNNTKQDLIKLYNVPADKIQVVYEGVNLETHNPQPITQDLETENHNKKSVRFQASGFRPYLLFIGRLEERKNVLGIIKTFEIFKEKYQIPHKLILAGLPGFGYKKIVSYLSHSSYKSDIILTGFVNEFEKWQLIKNADVFLFPSFYEGFGLPILEAQSAGVPVVASNVSSIPEITNCHDKCSALLVDPNNCEEIAEAVHKLISDQNLRQEIIRKGYENIKRFSWDKCAEEIKENLLN